MANNAIGGGKIDPQLYCTFESEICTPRKIKLPLGVGGVSWTYTLNHNIQDTYGGQVVQILGVSIDNLTIRGNFAGFDPHWGVDGSGKSRHGDRAWSNSPYASGIVQMAEWFRSYFEQTTQGAYGQQLKTSQRYSEKTMLFTFPARGWRFVMRPTAFPSVVLDNETNAPEWVVQAEFVEDAEQNQAFVSSVTDQAYSQIEQLKEGVGWERNNPLSGWITDDGETYDGITPTDALKKLLDSWEESVWNNFSEDEINDIIAMGYSYPLARLKAAGMKPEDFLSGITAPEGEVEDAITDVSKELQKWFNLSAQLFGDENG